MRKIILGGCTEMATESQKTMRWHFFWYKQAALQGHSDAQNNLADLYEDGKGVAQNKTLAAFWYLKSAQQGNRHAQFQIAWDYNAGEGVDPRTISKRCTGI